MSYTPLLTNGARTLQTELSNREGYKTILVSLQAMPLDQHIKGRHSESEACLEILPDPMHDFLEVADQGQHREDRLNQHAVIPRAALTQFEVGRIPRGGMEGRITEDNHALVKLPNQPLKGLIRHVGCPTIPRHHQPPLVQHQTQFAADNPAMIREAFAPDLLGAAAFAHGVDQLDPIRVNDAEHRRGSQESLGPRLMGHEEAKEPGALG